ncbi:amino acid ABC transporter substrate-binding protein [Burkholderia sp. MSMB1552]|nr:amino acid ABC transporter substrate-binding protein [Burkholderia humptydooensis]KVN11105.1 amino acid ABC transporter substrate-binding protein [Burkholderia sp. MSMB1552]KWZ55173.1 amino acid ABC transporter substrate-binding protein [Burkholderia sp. MSMB1588]
MHRFVAPIRAIVHTIRALFAHDAAPTSEAMPTRGTLACIVSAGPRPAFG